MFGKLFSTTPKWQHRDPEIRRRAIEDLGPGDGETLARVVREESQPGLRRLAIQLLCDPAVLAEASEKDTDAGVRELALSRFRKLLAGEAGAAEARFVPDLQERLRLARRYPSPELAEHLCLRAREPELRLALIDQVARDEPLAEAAINDRSLQVRLAAVEQLRGREALQRVFKETRKGDKSVNRRAKERLDALIETEARPLRIREEAERLCAQAERLGRGRQWEQDDATLSHLASQWERLATEAGSLLVEELQVRFAAARSAYLAASTAHHEEQRALHEAELARSALHQGQVRLVAEAEALLAEVRALDAPSDEVIEGLRPRLVALRDRWEELDVLHDAEAGRHLRRFDELLAELGRHLDLAAERRDAATVAAGLCEQVEAALGERVLHPADARELGQRLRRRLDALPKDAEGQALRERATALSERLERRLEEQRRQTRERLAHLPQWLDELEAEIEAGQVRPATALLDRIRSTLAAVEGQGDGDIRAAQGRLTLLTGRFKSLQDWQKWAVAHEHERLCQEMESLVGLDLHPTTLVEQIHGLQQEWRSLGGTRSAKGLWERFQEAGHRAYAPVRAYEEEQAAIREQNREARQTWLDQANAELDGIDWTQVDWKGLATREREIRRQWGEFGPVDRRHWRKLEQGLKELLARFEARLAPERERCLRARRLLIKQIEELGSQEDLARATEEVKRLQTEWQVTVPGGRREENALWQAFRAACDAVFERRREVRDSQGREEQANLARKQALCAEIEALRPETPEALDAAQARLQAIHEEWDGIGFVPKREVQSVERRHRDAVRAFEGWADGLVARQGRIEMERLGKRAVLCLELEGMALMGVTDEPAAAASETRWQDLPYLGDARTAESMQSRFECAVAAACGETAAVQILREAQPHHLARRGELCLHLEILAGIDSPPEVREARMALQVSRLSAAMQEGRPDDAEEAIRVERDWYLTGHAGAGEEALQARFLRALATIRGVASDDELH